MATPSSPDPQGTFVNRWDATGSNAAYGAFLRSLSRRGRAEPTDDEAVYRELCRSFERALRALAVMSATSGKRVKLEAGEGLVLASGRWDTVFPGLAELFNEGLVELKGVEPHVVRLPENQGWYESFRVGPFVTFSRPPEELVDPTTDVRAYVFTVNKDRNARTVRVVFPVLTQVPGVPHRYTIDGVNPIDGTIIESATEVDQSIRKVDFP